MPDLLSKVLLRGRRDLYQVVDADFRRNVVEVISIDSVTQHLIPDVPLSAIKELIEGPPDYL